MPGAAVVLFMALQGPLTGASHPAPTTPSAAAGPVDTVTTLVARALDQANAAFSAAWVARDWEAIVGMYTADAILHPPAGGVLVGADRIAAFWRPIASSQPLGHRLEPTVRRELASGVVLETGRWHSRRMRDGQEEDWIRGCYTLVWRLESDGRWRMEYDAWTNPIPADWACVPRI